MWPQAGHSPANACDEGHGIMGHLGTLTGNGNMEAKGTMIGHVDYSIDVWIEDRSNSKSARGRASGDFRTLEQVFNSGRATLHLAGGRTVNVMVTRLDGERNWR
jgi:hypothetical protein